MLTAGSSGGDFATHILCRILSFLLLGVIHMGEIALDVYFSKKLSLFLQLCQLFSGTFCIGLIVSIISTGQSHVPQSGKPIF